MKYLIIPLLFAALSIPALSQDQWSSTGDNYKNGRLSIGANSYWAPISIYSRANTNKNEGIALAFEGTNFPDIGFRFKANGTNYYQVLYNGSYIQWKHYEGGNYIPKMSLSNDGKLGLGISNPTVSLDVKANSISGGERLVKFQVSDASDDYFTIENNTGAGGQFIPSIVGFHKSDNRLALRLIASTASLTDNGNNALMVFDSRLNDSGIQKQITNRPLFQWSNYSSAKMTMLANGDLGIGATNPTEKLEVAGTIRSREVKVEVAAGTGPDYVFEPTYDLKSLEEIEQYIQSNKHLPEIPSAKEMEANGVQLGEMNMLLLKKIEELTLHLIELKKGQERLERENEVLKKLLEHE